MKDAREIRENIFHLFELYKSGKLGGEKMPEDENPKLDTHSKENYLYFTLPMALNYQRNSYKLWESANKTFQDKLINDCFSPQIVVQMPTELLREYLLKYKVAVQPNKQPIIWRTLCNTISHQFDNDIRNLFIQEDYSIAKVKEHISKSKSDFPYLGGKKILNYWLYVLEQYTDIQFNDREHITIAPDTHVIQASLKLGVIDEFEIDKQNVQDVVSERWKDILTETEYCPIDIHTPLWLWSRGKFEVTL